MDLNDLLGKGAGGQRPEHEDFWHLSDIVLGLDAGLDPTRMTPDQQEAAFRARFDSLHVDRESVIYMATQRSFRVLGVTNPFALMAQVGEVAKLSGVWLDAFSAGVLYERKYGG